jgi:hypothetical protein
MRGEINVGISPKLDQFYHRLNPSHLYDALGFVWRAAYAHG